ncbi:hypothetical protein [Streptomyces sp. CC208A]|uniref:hypothetical protein n=1 Tax=Streptomyces sp. CC208A TaxID=3044573 RepID=UPI0024A9F8FC|nr:hypothetical protein [Streptomyces sp. CC208A]
MPMSPSSQSRTHWADAVRRATDVTSAYGLGEMDESCWDDVAIRNIIAVVLYALSLGEGQPVDKVSWPAVLDQLHDDTRVSRLVNSVLPQAGHDLSRTAALGDPVAECWRWLTRTWDPKAPTLASMWQQPFSSVRVPPVAEPRWGGLTRGIARGLPDPALEVCTPWAESLVQQAALAADPTLPVPELDHNASPDPGPLPDDTNRDAFERPATCADDLATLLDRAENPSVVPESLRAVIAAAHEHHHLELDWQATPEPSRYTWRTLQHWYQPDGGGDPVSVYEVVVTRHLHDPAPVHHLALSENDLPELIARCTTS